MGFLQNWFGGERQMEVMRGLRFFYHAFYAFSALVLRFFYARSTIVKRLFNAFSTVHQIEEVQKSKNFCVGSQTEILKKCLARRKRRSCALVEGTASFSARGWILGGPRRKKSEPEK